MLEKDNDNFPTIPVQDFIDLVEASSKVLGIIDAGSIKAFVIKGQSAIGKRTVPIRTNLPEIDYEYAIGLAFRAGVLSKCTEWFDEHKKFKDGAYYEG